MAARARGSTHLAMVNTIAKCNHLRCCSLWNRQTCGFASIRMRALWWFGRLFDDVTSRCSVTGTCGDVGRSGVSSAAIDDFVDAPAYIVRNVERTVWSYCQ